MVTGFVGNRSFALDVAMLPKTSPATGLSFLSIDRKCVVVSSARMTDVISTAAKGDSLQLVVDIKDEGRLNPDGRMQR